jgi:hypothetical protein
MLCRIKDILYQNNGKGPYMTSKVGKKYDLRRGHIFDFDRSKLVPGESCYILFEDGPGWIITTPVISTTEINENIFHLETENSVYVLEKVNKENYHE